MKKLFTLTALAALALAVTLALPALAAPVAQTIRVTETNYRIALSAKPKAGPTTFVVRNASDDEHDFWLRGGGKTVKTPLLDPGQTGRLRITLKRGVRYQLWCSPHADEGMRTSFVAR